MNDTRDLCKGEIVRLRADKGFGFIKSEIFEQEIFFHYTSVDDADNLSSRDLIEGMSVLFSPQTSEVVEGGLATELVLISMKMNISKLR